MDLYRILSEGATRGAFEEFEGVGGGVEEGGGGIIDWI